jgi:pimeloyl-ACP methyl ester carboxylesterase
MRGGVDERAVFALGLRTRVLEVGSAGDEEAVVFLHGQPGSAEDWLELLPRVAPFARAVALDWPSFGKADKPPRKTWDFSAGTYSTFLAAVLSELGIRHAHLVMHDLGGVAVLWAAAHPGAFASAVLINTGVLVDFRWHWLARLYRAPGVGELLVALTNRPGFRAFVRFYNPQPRTLPRRIVDRWYDEYTRNTAHAMLAFYRATPAESMERLTEPLRALDRPALVVWGAHDPAVSVEQAERQRMSFPSAEVVVLPDSGHWPYLDDPEGAANSIVPFLERQASASVFETADSA